MDHYADDGTNPIDVEITPLIYHKMRMTFLMTRASFIALTFIEDDSSYVSTFLLWEEKKQEDSMFSPYIVVQLK